MEQHRILELKINFAKDIKNLSFFSKMDVYAVASISGDYNHNQKVKTPVQKEGGTHPVWNFPINLTFNETLARQNRLTLEILLRCKTFPADKDIGIVHVPLAEILNNTGDGKSFQHVSYQVRRSSGRHKGSLNFSYKFGDSVPAQAKPSQHYKAEPAMAYPPPAKAQAEPVVAYPPQTMASSSYAQAYPPQPPEKQQYPAGYSYPYPPPGAGYPQGQPAYGYPPQHSGYGYPPQQVGYGYPPQQGGYGYGYPPPQQGYGYHHHGQGQKPGKSNFGPGLGLGLLGGAVGGLLIGDMVSDAFDDDVGYDLF